MRTKSKIVFWVALLTTGVSHVYSKYFGKEIGELEETYQDVKGIVYAADLHTIIVQNFSYSGNSTGVHFWGDAETLLTENGVILPIRNGHEPLGAYLDEDVIVVLPSEVPLTDLRSFGVWDTINKTSLGHVTVPEDLVPPEEMTLGPFSSPVKSGPVIVKDDRTIVITRLQLICPSGDYEFSVGNSSVPEPDGSTELLISNRKEIHSVMLEKLTGSGKQEIITLTFPDDLRASDVGWIGVRCSVRSGDNFAGYVLFPRTGLDVPPSLSPIGNREVKEFRDVGVYSGVQVGSFEDTLHEVKGDVYLASENSFIISGFTYDGKAPDAHFWAGSTDKPSPKGFIVPSEQESEENLGEYHDQDLLLKLPSGKTITDIKWLAVWCKSFNAVFGYVDISPTVEPPKEVTIGPLPTLAHSVSSSPVVIKDEHTIVIPNMFYDGLAPDAYFLLGKGTKIRHENAVKLSRDGSFERIMRGMRGLDVTLKLPTGQSVRDFDWLSVYCISFREDFGHVFIPKRLLVPPVLKRAEPLKSPKSDNGHNRDQYFGKLLGVFQEGIHQVKGTVYAASRDTIFLKDFSYDGLGQDTYFWVGVEESVPSAKGFAIPDEQGGRAQLKAYQNRDILLTLPNNGSVDDLKYFSIWSKRVDGSFGHVIFPTPVNAPSEQSLGRLTSYAHGVSSGEIKIKDSKTIFIEDFHYDGQGPDTFFLVGKGPYPLPNGTKVPDENGSLEKIHAYNGENVTLRLPGDLTVSDIDWFSLYSIIYTENFGHIFFPKDLNVPADLNSLRQQNTEWSNCEVIFPGFLQVSWNLEPEHIHVRMQGKLKSNEYMSFGISPDPNVSKMVGSDVVLAYQRMSSPKANLVDYHLSAKAQCSDGVGACPDVKVGGTDDVTMTSSQRKDELLTVTYRRPLRASEPHDLDIITSGPVAVVAAIGHIDSRHEAAFHHAHYVKETLKLDFGRQPSGPGTCNDLESSEDGTSKSKDLDANAGRLSKADEPWERGIIRSDVQLFNAQLGPTGGDKGYNAITGHHSWGYAWWINGELIPELQVTRGTTYTFEVEGGSRHPLYITDNPQGGGQQYPDELEKEGHRVFAGLSRNSSGPVFPIGVGRLCEWKHQNFMERSYESYAAFKRTLSLVCQEGTPGSFTWTPDSDTPDTVYYQCFVHRNFGWKIHVRNSGN